MSWYASTSSYRIPVAVNNHNGSASIDVTITIPADFGLFWSEVSSNGHDIKLTDSDGFTPVVWQRETWDYANRSAVLQINDWSPDSADGTVIAFLYFGEASPTDTSGPAFTASTPKTGLVLAGVPPAAATIVQAESLPVDSDVPVTRYSWPPGQSGFVIFDVTRHLATQAKAFNNASDFEEIAVVEVETRNGGVVYAGGNTPSKTRVSQYNGRTLVWMFLTGSVAQNDYIDEITITTSLGRTLIFSALRKSETAEES